MILIGWVDTHSVASNAIWFGGFKLFLLCIHSGVEPPR